MNQILSVEMPKSKKGAYRNKNSNKADIRTIIIFFCIILILFAMIIGIVAISTLNKKESGETQQGSIITGTQPKINIEIQNETTLNIIVTHDKQISLISYNWNDGEKIEEKDIGENTKELKVEIPSGTNTLNVSVTDINGVISTKSEQYTGKQEVVVDGPSIILEQQENKVKLTAQSENTISYVSYNWDGGEETQIQVNDVKTEQLIDILKGEHTLNIVVVDIEGGETAKSIKMIGDTKPTLNITTDNVNLFIEASDDEKLTKLVVEIYDTKETKEFDINEPTFSKKISIKNGELPLNEGENKIIFTLYNVNGLKNVQYKKIYK